MIFLGVLDNLKKDHVNALAIQLHCQKLFSSYFTPTKRSDAQPTRKTIRVSSCCDFEELKRSRNVACSVYDN